MLRKTQHCQRALKRSVQQKSIKNMETFNKGSMINRVSAKGFLRNLANRWRCRALFCSMENVLSFP
ncbi:hypothetical protein K737_301072 [Holospora undulata HU1]|uniref:Uncharacterized protein n=1 Tax=Holospora undulata HU1 TaxID=1321371 RepID=A0A061JFT4_9PROT|nr:hypothetical protein K737_301072 [Holospora undulata HU1]